MRQVVSAKPIVLPTTAMSSDTSVSGRLKCTGAPASKPSIAMKCVHQIATPAEMAVSTCQPSRCVPEVFTVRWNRRAVTHEPPPHSSAASNTSQWLCR